MIERVARAIMRADTEGNPRFDYEEWIGKEWPHYASQARAAIAAMREPSNMIDAALECSTKQNEK